jgi:hypothetical protein
VKKSKIRLGVIVAAGFGEIDWALQLLSESAQYSWNEISWQFTVSTLDIISLRYG